MIVDQNDACHYLILSAVSAVQGRPDGSALSARTYIYASGAKRASFFRDTMNRAPPDPRPDPRHDPAPPRRRYRRLRTLQRVGLLAPLLKLQRKIDGR